MRNDFPAKRLPNQKTEQHAANSKAIEKLKKKHGKLFYGKKCRYRHNVISNNETTTNTK